MECSFFALGGDDLGCVRARRGWSLLVVVLGVFACLTMAGYLNKTLVHNGFGWGSIVIDGGMVETLVLPVVEEGAGEANRVRGVQTGFTVFVLVLSPWKWSL